MTDLTIPEMSKSDLNKIVKSIDKLVELGQIQQPSWFMTDEKGVEVDAHYKRVEKQMWIHHRKWLEQNQQ
mgnify:CR=1 FL=1